MQNAKVRLRPLLLDDAVHYGRLLGDDWETIKTTGTLPFPCTETAAREWLANRLTEHNRFFAILRQTDDEFVGAIGLVKASEQAYAIGYWIGGLHANNGYATAAVALCIALARSLNTTKLHADTFPENAASAHILKKAGFVFTGEVVKDVPLRGGLRAIYEYELKLK